MNINTTKKTVLGKKIMRSSTQDSVPFHSNPFSVNTPNDLSVSGIQCHFCSLSASKLICCIQCMTHFCLKCISSIGKVNNDKSLVTNSQMNCWVCFICRDKCTCNQCKATPKDRTKEKKSICYICIARKNMKSISEYKNSAKRDEYIKKGEQLLLLFQGSQKEKCSKCFQLFNDLIFNLLNSKPLEINPIEEMSFNLEIKNNNSNSKTTLSPKSNDNSDKENIDKQTPMPQIPLKHDDSPFQLKSITDNNRNMNNTLICVFNLLVKMFFDSLESNSILLQNITQDFQLVIEFINVIEIEQANKGIKTGNKVYWNQLADLVNYHLVSMKEMLSDQKNVLSHCKEKENELMPSFIKPSFQCCNNNMPFFNNSEIYRTPTPVFNQQQYINWQSLGFNMNNNFFNVNNPQVMFPMNNNAFKFRTPEVLLFENNIRSNPPMKLQNQ